MKKDCLENITDLKSMLEITGKIYSQEEAYKLRVRKQENNNNEYKIYTHKEVRDIINYLGTSLIDLGLKGKRIAVIGENRFEWEIAYLAIVCGAGIVVPLDKSLPENELKRLIERSEVEAIFYSSKYENMLQKMLLSGVGVLKHLISMDKKISSNGIYSEYELIEKGKLLIENGDTRYLKSKINPNEMSIMLFTSGTTSESKVVMLSHSNIVSNLKDLKRALKISPKDNILSFLPLHHVFECTVGFLLAYYGGARISFCDGVRHIEENLKEYEITFAAFVPAIFENFYKTVLRRLDKKGILEETFEKAELFSDKSFEEKRKEFKEIYDIFGGHSRMFMSGAAPISAEILNNLKKFGINICQGYGLTETSPVVGVETDEENRLGSIGRALPSVSVKIEDANSEGIGELLVKGPNVMLGYYENAKATNAVLSKDGWFRTGDLALIDEDGYIFIKGRKKSVIVLKNGKNIFPEEMENLVNRIEGVKESFIFGKSNTKDEDDIKIFAKIVYDREIMNASYKVLHDDEIFEELDKKIKEINKTMPPYKSIRGLYLTENELIKTASGKIKRYEEIKTIN